MKIAPKPSNERFRQKALENYKILDTMPEESYDAITNIIATICNTPIALITLLDNERNYFKSSCGLDASESPRDISFCSHAVVSDKEITIVPDAREDGRFIGNPLIEEQASIFYAGVPLVNKDGYKLGTLCVYDHIPRELDENQIYAMKSMAKQVMMLFEERKLNFALLDAQQELEDRNQELKDFAAIISHDLKTPLSQISMISHLLAEENKTNFSETSREYLIHLENAGFNLSRYIDGVLNFYRSDELINDRFQTVSFSELVEDIIAMSVNDKKTEVTYYPENDATLFASKAALHQILLNLVTNSIKYSDKELTKIHVELSQNEFTYAISVEDNGRGIPADKIDHVFKLFYTADEEDKNGLKGTGIGLATTQRLIKQLEGSIKVESKVGSGTTMTIELPKATAQEK